MKGRELKIAGGVLGLLVLLLVAAPLVSSMIIAHLEYLKEDDESRLKMRNASLIVNGISLGIILLTALTVYVIVDLSSSSRKGHRYAPESRYYDSIYDYE